MRTKNEALALIGWNAAGLLSAFVCLLQLAVMVAATAGRPGLLAGAAPVALGGTFVLGYWFCRWQSLELRLRWSTLGVVLGISAAALGFSAFYYDFSWDGQWYHQTGILSIAKDWNPIADPMGKFADHLELWVRHYAKSTWYAAAAIYKLTGSVELGKCVNGLSLGAGFFAVLAACLDAGLPRARSVGVALAVAVNPVSMSELTTFLLDGVMVGFLTVVVAAGFSGLRRPTAPVLAAGVAASIACINTKLNGLVFLCFVYAAIGLWCFFKRRDLLARYVGLAVVTLVLGVAVWGYNPYITNSIHRHQPFYPVLGSKAFPSLTEQKKEGIEMYETPKNLLGRNRLARLGYAIFGRPSNAPYFNGPNAELMIPFRAVPGDLYAYRFHETRVAGFGPWFSGALILASALGLWLLATGRGFRGALGLTIAALVGSLVISLHLWWPRYGPQLWLLPIVPIVFVFAEGRSPAQMRTAWVILVLLVANAAIVAGVRLHWETTATLKLRRQLRALHDSGRVYEVGTNFFTDATTVRLSAAGVRFRDLGVHPVKDGQELVSVVEPYPLAIRYRPMREAATPASAPAAKTTP